jgi:hypothetical protein
MRSRSFDQGRQKNHQSAGYSQVAQQMTDLVELDIESSDNDSATQSMTLDSEHPHAINDSYI